MKLYATVTSERATKGQGGKWLDIVVKDEKKNLLGTIKITPMGESAVVRLKFLPDVTLDIVGDEVKMLMSDTKGEKQKGELHGHDNTIIAKKNCIQCQQGQ